MRESISSKKFMFSIGAVLVAFAYAVLAGWRLPGMTSMYEAFCGILEFVTAAYVLGNVGNKWVLGKATAEAPPTKKKMTLTTTSEPADPLDHEPSK